MECRGASYVGLAPGLVQSDKASYDVQVAMPVLAAMSGNVQRTPMNNRSSRPRTLKQNRWVPECQSSRIHYYIHMNPPITGYSPNAYANERMSNLTDFHRNLWICHELCVPVVNWNLTSNKLEHSGGLKAAEDNDGVSHKKTYEVVGENRHMVMGKLLPLETSPS